MVLFAFLLILPIIIAGMSMIVCLKCKWFSFLRYPLDGFKKMNGKRIFGDNKTWLGLTVMAFISATAGTFLWFVSSQVQSILRTPVHALFMYALLGALYSIGELPNSFFKRQLDIAPGLLPDSTYKPLFQFVDLIDGILLVGFLMWFMLPLKVSTVLLSIFLGILTHYMLHQLMVMLNLKRE